MSAYVKMTDANCRTRGDTLWEPGVRVQCADPNAPLGPSSSGVILCYAGATQAEALALAAMMDPAHGRYGAQARVFAFTPEGEVRNGGDKAVCRAGAIGEELTLPEPTDEQRVEFGIRATLLMPQAADSRRWAARWLSGEDRSAESAEMAAAATAEWTEAEEAAWPAEAAAWAWAAEWMPSETAAWAAGTSAWSAAAAAAAAAANEDLPLPLASLALAVLEGRGEEFTEEVQS